mgnify:CR=1 FL=1
MEQFLCISIGYLFGNFQSSYIFVRLFKNKDIRDIGSGNPGTMNTLLNVNRTLGALVLFCDMLKTIIPSIICTIIFPGVESIDAVALCSLGVFLGHCFPFWLSFKGGKGVAVAVAFALTIDLRVFLVSVIVAGVFGFLLKSATYGSYTFAIMLFVCAVDFNHSLIVILCALIQSVGIAVLHIKRKPTPKSIRS